MTTQLIFDFDERELGYYLYQRRIQKDWSQKRLVIESGVKYSYITKLEDGKCKTMDAIKIMKIAKALDIELKFCLVK